MLCRSDARQLVSSSVPSNFDLPAVIWFFLGKPLEDKCQI